MEEQEEFKKVTLLDQLSIAVSSPKNYRHLVFRKKGRLVLFVAVLSFLLAFIEFGIDTIFWINKVGGFGNLATNEIPAFEYKNGRLAIERDVQLEFSGATLYINTEKAAVDLNDMETDGVYVTIGSEKIVMGMVTGGVGYTYMETPLSYMMLPEGFDNAVLASLSSAFYMYIVFMFIFIMIGKVIKQLLLALMFSIVGNAFAKNLNSGLSYGNVLTICMYAQTLPMLIMSVNTAVGGILPSFAVWLATLVIAMMFMNRGISSCVNNDVPPGDVF